MARWYSIILLYHLPPHVTANVVAHTAANTGCEYAGQWKQVFALLEQTIRTDRVQPNQWIMGAVIGACAKAYAMEYSINHINNDSEPLPPAQLYEYDSASSSCFYNNKTGKHNHYCPTSRGCNCCKFLKGLHISQCRNDFYPP
jgi:hypothetical protein